MTSVYERLKNLQIALPAVCSRRRLVKNKCEIYGVKAPKSLSKWCRPRYGLAGVFERRKKYQWAQVLLEIA